MEFLSKHEINLIVKQYGHSKILRWTFEDLQDKTAGYLGEHLNLTVDVECNGVKSTLDFFVKCMPRFDLKKAEYLEELGFFKKEYIMLSDLFGEFENNEGSRKWRPKLLFIKKNVFVFENVTRQGYTMPDHRESLTYEELTATIATLARFHAQSFIYEETQSKKLGRPYRIWDNYSDHLGEPGNTKVWRDTGAKAVIDLLKVFSIHKSKPKFQDSLEIVVSRLYMRAEELMKPSSKYRNVVVHRDLWTNNIFLKHKEGIVDHAIFVDFQTVLYASPMLDLSSLIYFNTSRTFRNAWTDKLIHYYYTVLSEELKVAGINVEDIINKNNILEAYEKSIVFGITQAGLIVPIATMSKKRKEEIFHNPDLVAKADLVSRSEEFIYLAKEDEHYRNRVIDLLEEIVERFVFQ